MAYFSAGIGGQPRAPLYCSGTSAPDAATPIAGTTPIAHRILLHIVMSNGDWWGFIEAREGFEDYSVPAIYLTISRNQGESWSTPTLVFRRSDYVDGSAWLNLGSAVPDDANNKRVHLLFFKQDGLYSSSLQVCTLWHTYCDDLANGLTWSAPTDRSSTGIKANASTPASQPACYDATNNNPWKWYALGPNPGLRLKNGGNAGTIVFPANHRYTIGGTSWSHCLYSDDQMVTLKLGSGFDETNATNNNSNELALVENADGTLYAACRMVNGSGRRGGATITNFRTGTWPTVAYQTDGTNQLTSNSCQGSLWIRGDGSIVQVCPSDDGARSRLRIYVSSDGGATWPPAKQRDLFYDRAGYSQIFGYGSGRYCVLAEVTDDGPNFYTNSSYQYIRQFRFDDAWLDGPATYPNQLNWYFNDAATGSPPTSGTGLREWSAMCAPGRGGASVSYDASGLVFSGSGAGAVLSETHGNLGGAFDPLTGSITYELVGLFPTSGNNRTIFDNRNASGAGVTLSLTALHKASFAISDGTTTKTVTATPNVDDGNVHAIACSVDRGGNIRIYVDGGNVNSTADTMSGAVKIKGSGNFTLGSKVNGTLPLDAGSHIYRLRVTSAGITTGLLSASDTKPTAAAAASVSVPATPAPAWWSHVKCAMFAPWALGYGSSTDRFTGLDWPQLPLSRRGQGISGWTDPISGQFFTLISQYRPGYWDKDADAGWHVRLRFGGQTSPGGYACPVTSAFDYFQNNANGTVLGLFNWHTFTGGAAAIFDNCAATSSNKGMICGLDSSNHPTFGITLGGSWRCNESYTGLTASADTWYFCAFTAGGAGVKAACVLAPFSRRKVPTLPAATQMAAAITGSDVSDSSRASTQAPTWGGNSPQNSWASDMRCAGMLLLDTALTAAQLQQAATLLIDAGAQSAAMHWRHDHRRGW